MEEGGECGEGGKVSSVVGSRLGSSSRLDKVSADRRAPSKSMTPPSIPQQSEPSTGPSSAILLRHARDSG